MSKIRCFSDNNYAWTDGLAKINHPELRVWVQHQFLLPEATIFLKTMISYIEENEVLIQDNETVTYGYWLTKFLASRDGFLDVWENNKEGSQFIFGATLTLTYWQQQHELCKRANTQFLPPNPGQFVAISQGVLEGEETGGARFMSPEHMSGWWITTDQYNGDVSTLKVIHLFHLTAVRPDLVQYLALPYGYRFVQYNSRERVWYDEEIAADQTNR